MNDFLKYGTIKAPVVRTVLESVNRVMRIMASGESHEITKDEPTTDSYLDADLITSELEGGLGHAPVIDLDIPHKYVESSTPGHGHLYIDVPIDSYLMDNLMAALYDANIIEKGYYDSYNKRGYSAVRPPWKKKS